MRPSSTARDRGRGKRRDLHVPLVGEPGLEHRAAAVATRHRQRVRLRLLEQAGSLEVGHDALARREAIEAAIGRRNFVVEHRVGREDVDERQTVTAPDLVVVEVVPGRDLDAAAAERGIDVVVGDDRDQSSGQRQPDLASDEVTIALVVGMHRDRRVAQHRFGSRRGDDEVTAAHPRAGSADARAGPLPAQPRPRGRRAPCAAPGPS